MKETKQKTAKEAVTASAGTTEDEARPLKVLQIATREPERYMVYDLKTGRLARHDEETGSWARVHVGAVLLNVGDVKTFSPLEPKKEEKNGK